MARPDETGNDGGSSQERQQSLRRRLLRQHMLPLTRPSPEVTVEEGTFLFNSFLYEDLQVQGLVAPEIGIENPTTHDTIPFASPINDSPRAHSHGAGDVCFDSADSSLLTENVSDLSAAGASANVQRPTDYQRLGREIRRYADDFASSEHGQKIKKRANEVDLENLDCQGLQEILTGIFHDGRFSVTTIVAVFVFCSTLVIRALRDAMLKNTRDIIKWCFKFIQDGVCKMVQKEGGWEVVVHGVVGSLFKLGATLLIASAALTALFFIWKK